MTNYNDGQIHGWNGGDCPVHPKTMVELFFRGQIPPEEDIADDWEWYHDKMPSDIIAFRVVKEYVDPKVIWVNEYPTGNAVCTSKEAAHKVAGPGATRIAVKYVEAIADAKEVKEVPRTSVLRDEELIAYLRLQGLDKDITAADRIELLATTNEQLVATNEALSIANATLIAERDDYAFVLKNSGIVEIASRNNRVTEYMFHWEGRALEAEAKLAKAVEALENIAHGGAYTDMQIARTALAEIKGESQ